MYKVTKNGKTMVGCNEDAWRTTPHIWFEIDNKKAPFGAAFTGSRFDGKNGYAPQSGMNEHGLVYSRLASYYPENKNYNFKNRLEISNPTQYLKDILHNCKTVEDVKKYIEKYNHSYFLEDVFIYIDKSGKYIVVEPYKIISGNDASYVLSNFCPSITSKDDAFKLKRYQNGVLFLNKKLETDLEFCQKLSDTMHVCREKIGDGTLLTSIWDATNGTVNLYFYHKYNKTIQFNIKEELAKGNHIIKVDSLFPKNTEFEKLASYQVPHNNDTIRFILLFFGLFFISSSIYFLINYFKNRKMDKYNRIKILLIPFSIILFYYMYVLNTNVNIYYFASPYKSSFSSLISLTSYLPYVLLLIIFPLIRINFKLIKEKLWTTFSLVILSLNSLLYLILIGFFVYWRFYFNF
jgi:cytochrome c oxidase subunit IV